MNKKVYGAILLLWWTYTLPRPPESYRPPRLAYQPAALLTIRDALRNINPRVEENRETRTLNTEFFNLQLEQPGNEHQIPPIDLSEPDPLHKEQLDR